MNAAASVYIELPKSVQHCYTFALLCIAPVQHTRHSCGAPVLIHTNGLLRDRPSAPGLQAVYCVVCTYGAPATMVPIKDDEMSDLTGPD